MADCAFAIGVTIVAKKHPSGTLKMESGGTTSAKYMILMARPDGFEPPTPRFVVWCSIQLSYGRLW